jgi:hypothetical protein
MIYRENNIKKHRPPRYTINNLYNDLKDKYLNYHKDS